MASTYKGVPVMSGRTAVSCVTVKDGENTFQINLIEPKKVRSLALSSILLVLLSLLFVTLMPPATESWLKLNLAIMVPYILLSLIFIVFPRRFAVEFFLYGSLTILLFSIICLVLGLRLMDLFSIKPTITVGFLYILVLPVMFLRRKKIFEGAAGSPNGSIISYPLIAAAIGTSIGMLISRTFPAHLTLAIAGIAFIVLAAVCELGAIISLYKYLLIKKSGYKVHD